MSLGQMDGDGPHQGSGAVVPLAQVQAPGPTVGPAVPWEARWLFGSFAGQAEVQCGVSRFPGSAVFPPVGATPRFAEHGAGTV